MKMKQREPFTLRQADADRISKVDDRIRQITREKNLYRGGGGVCILGIAVAEKLVAIAEKARKTK